MEEQWPTPRSGARDVRPANPYAELSALLDTTRQLDPEEMAELHLEQGFVDRALAIYEDLVRQHPDRFHYRRRRDWLARLAGVAARATLGGVDSTMRGVRAPTAAPSPPSALEVRRVAIIGVE